jgi:Uma2 family endonuclease
VIVLDGISWLTYQKLADEIGYRRSVRLTYDRGRLELMSPLPEHEAYSVQLSQFVRVIAVACQVPFKCLGAMTIRREDLARGLEPDNCFYLASWPRIRGRKVLDFTVDPPPDLVWKSTSPTCRSTASRFTRRCAFPKCGGLPAGHCWVTD